MSPVLKPGDIAIIEDRPYEPHHIVQAVRDAEDCLRIVNGRLLEPINTEFPTMEVEHWMIVGVLVGVIRQEGYGVTVTYDYAQGAYAEGDKLFR